MKDFFQWFSTLLVAVLAVAVMPGCGGDSSSAGDNDSSDPGNPDSPSPNDPTNPDKPGEPPFVPDPNDDTPVEKAATCDQPASGPAVTSIASGDWSEPSIWSTGSLPAVGAKVTIDTGHSIAFDCAQVTLGGLDIAPGATLSFAGNVESAVLRTDKNILVRGKLEMKTESRNAFQHIEFINVDESAFVGGGMDVLESDVGLWVMENGQIDLQGSAKTPWTRLKGAVTAGQTAIELETPPAGWKVGDHIAIAPTLAPTVDNDKQQQDSDHAMAYDEMIIEGIDGAAVTLSTALQYDHPSVTFDDWNGKSLTYSAEVMNLTRNVKVSGTSDGGGIFDHESHHRAHILVRAQQPQYVRYVELQHLAPRQEFRKCNREDEAGNCEEFGRQKTGGVLGRYALHFHHAHQGVAGSLVEGNAAHDIGGHVYVPHNAHGVMLLSNVSHNSVGDAYWWDLRERRSDIYPETNDSLWAGNIASKATAKIGTTHEGSEMSGFSLNSGDDLTNLCVNNVAVGIYTIDGQVLHASATNGFSWPEQSSESTGRVWQFENNLAHNIGGAGTFVWQNSNKYEHLIEKFVSYHNGSYGVDHGAYSNFYQYRDLTLYKNRRAGFANHAVTRGFNKRTEDFPNLRFENVMIDGGGLSTYAVSTPSHRLRPDIDTPAEYVDLHIRNIRRAVFREEQNGNPTIAEVWNPVIEGDPTLFDFKPGVNPDILFTVHHLNNSDEVFTATTTNPKNVIANKTPIAPPKVLMVDLKHGQGVQGTVSVKTQTTSTEDLAVIKLYIDHKPIETVTDGELDYSWDTAQITNGLHTISIVAESISGLKSNVHTGLFVSN